MQTQRIDSGPDTPESNEPDLDPTDVQAAVLMALLSEEHRGLWTREELDRALSSSKLAVTDALTELRAAGLVHTHAELVLPTRAAQHMDRLSL
jgi:hypothetical protein